MKIHPKNRKKNVAGDQGGPGVKRGRSRPAKVDVFNTFAAWLVLPAPLRNPRRQKDFAAAYNVREATVSDWKNRTDLWDRVRSLRQNWGGEKTGNVIAKFYQQIMSSKEINVRAYRLWLQFFCGPTQKVEANTSVPAENPLVNLSNRQLDNFIERKAKVLRVLRDCAS